jgi:hypothetical protein
MRIGMHLLPYQREAIRFLARDVPQRPAPCCAAGLPVVRRVAVPIGHDRVVWTTPERAELLLAEVDTARIRAWEEAAATEMGRS